ncbi:MAG: Gfo/Idh/MocA family oxidoreductase [Pirellulaceae bacterium]|nr:Gfo/Idh/MocA family oxidoreductase [Pirellulaceae bacterium]
MPPTSSRRQFLGQCAWAAAATTGFWSELAAQEAQGPNDRLHLAAIGVGNRGSVNLAELRSENVVALCDVDQQQLDQQHQRYPQAAVYRDFRRLLERRDLDAVVISTPDHTHFHPAWAALQLGLHVYCEKPLAHSIWEVRQLAEAARRAGVATQMGNQHHASSGYARVVDWVRSGRLGTIREVHSWTDRPLWPQGVDRPVEVLPVPDHLDWDLWLGPAPERPYHSIYHPIRWRGWWDFGGGALADMGPHLLDPAYWALELALPERIEARSDPVHDETLPESSQVTFEFAASGRRPAVRVHWYDGGRKPAREVTGTDDPPANGTLLVGTEARLFAPELGGRPLVIPLAGKERPESPPASVPVSPGHHAEWLRACKGGPAAGSEFSYAARLTETCLLGNIAIRTGQTLTWLADSMRFADCRQADALLRREYREGWRAGT